MLAAVIIAVGFAACLFLNLPGQFSYDSIVQLAEGRSGTYNEWHPPVMAWLLGLFDRITPGAPWFMVFDSVLGFGALFAFVALEPRPRFAGLLAVAGLAASPLILIYQGEVWKDVLFADSAVAGFAALAWTGRVWAWRGVRFLALVLSFVLFALAALARQNGAIVLAFGAGALALIAAHRTTAGKAWAYGAGALLLTGAVIVVASFALHLRSDGEPETRRQFSLLQAYDLAGEAAADPTLDLSRLRLRAPATEAFVRIRAAPAYTAARVDPIVSLPGLDAVLDRSGDAIAEQWRAVVTMRPGLYLRVRSRVFGWIAAAPDAARCAPVVIGLDGPPDAMRQLGLTRRQRPKDDWARRYGLAFVGGPVFSHLAYAALAVVLIGLAVRDYHLGRRDESVVVIAMLGAAILFAASFFVIGFSCDYRYLYFLDLAAMTAFAHRAAVRFPTSGERDPRRRGRNRTADNSPRHPPSG